MNTTQNQSASAVTFIALITSNIVYIVVIAMLLYSEISSMGITDILNDPKSDLVLLWARWIAATLVMINSMYRKYSVSQLTGNNAELNMSVAQKRWAPSLNTKILALALLESSSIYTLVISLLLLNRAPQVTISDPLMMWVLWGVVCIISSWYSYNAVKKLFDLHTQQELESLDMLPVDNATPINKAKAKMILAVAIAEMPVVILLAYILFMIYN